LLTKTGDFVQNAGRVELLKGSDHCGTLSDAGAD